MEVALEDPVARPVTGERLLEQLEVGLEVLGVGDLLEGQHAQLVLGVPEHGAQRPVRGEQLPGRADQGHPHWGVLERGPPEALDARLRLGHSASWGVGVGAGFSTMPQRGGPRRRTPESAPRVLTSWVRFRFGRDVDHSGRQHPMTSTDDRPLARSTHRRRPGVPRATPPTAASASSSSPSARSGSRRGGARSAWSSRRSSPSCFCFLPLEHRGRASRRWPRCCSASSSSGSPSRCRSRSAGFIGVGAIVLLGVATADDALAPFGSSTVFTFIGAFILAAGDAQARPRQAVRDVRPQRCPASASRRSG